ncbi:hypothetical protein ACFY1G_04605 [Streptomyces olivaceus]|uniref:hypothetical protein n=2 Tax=Streptomyces TaxID=1883 RepID=UPI002A0EDA06|nr:hypothetical protein [Streptomyces olivaceus]
MLDDGAVYDRTAHDRVVKGGTGLRAEALALLLEPLGADAVAGPAALQRFAEEVAAVARARGYPDLPASGSTLPPVSEAVVGSVTYLDTPGVAAKDDDHGATRARAACDDADAVTWNYADTLHDEEAAELPLAGSVTLSRV